MQIGTPLNIYDPDEVNAVTVTQGENGKYSFCWKGGTRPVVQLGAMEDPLTNYGGTKIWDKQGLIDAPLHGNFAWAFGDQKKVTNKVLLKISIPVQSKTFSFFERLDSLLQQAFPGYTVRSPLFIKEDSSFNGNLEVQIWYDLVDKEGQFKLPTAATFPNGAFEIQLNARIKKEDGETDYPLHLLSQGAEGYFVVQFSGIIEDKVKKTVSYKLSLKFAKLGRRTVAPKFFNYIEVKPTTKKRSAIEIEA